MFKKRIITVQNNFDEVKSLLKSIHSKSLCFIFYGEDIYTDSIEIPTARTKWIEEIVRNNLIYKFDDISNLCYSYETLEKVEGQCRIRMFCINTDKSTLLGYVTSRSKVSSVYLIQFCYIYYVVKELKESDFILIFNSEDHTYLLSCSKRVLEHNYIFKTKDIEAAEVMNKIEFIKSNKYESEKNLQIILLNYDYKEIIEKVSDQLNVRNLGSVEENRIIKKYVGAR